MKKIFLPFLLLFPAIASAQQIPDFRSLVDLLLSFLPEVLTIIALIVFLYFVWRIADFILHADSKETRSTAQRVFLWGILALFIIASLTAIISFFLGEFNLGSLIIPTLPTAGGSVESVTKNCNGIEGC